MCRNRWAVGVDQAHGTKATTEKIFGGKGKSLTKTIAALREKFELLRQDTDVGRLRANGRVGSHTNRARTARFLNRRPGIAKKTDVQLRGLLRRQRRYKSRLNITGTGSLGHHRQRAGLLRTMGEICRIENLVPRLHLVIRRA